MPEDVRTKRRRDRERIRLAREVARKVGRPSDARVDGAIARAFASALACAGVSPRDRHAARLAQVSVRDVLNGAHTILVRDGKLDRRKVADAIASRLESYPGLGIPLLDPAHPDSRRPRAIPPAGGWQRDE